MNLLTKYFIIKINRIVKETQIIRISKNPKESQRILENPKESRKMSLLRNYFIIKIVWVSLTILRISKNSKESQRISKNPEEFIYLEMS